MKNLIYTFACLLLLLINSNLKGQGFSIHINSFPNILNGQHFKLIVPFAEIGTTYEYWILSKKTSIGINFRSINWGNEIGLTQGLISRDRWMSKIKYNNKMNLHVSLPLYYNKNRLSYGVSYVLNISHSNIERLSLITGTRFNFYPGYSEVSEKSYFLELVLGVKYRLTKT